jgi:predicted dehydrogenase
MRAGREIRVGVIGAGRRGLLAHYAHQPSQGVRLVAAADIRDDVLRDFRGKFGPECLVTRDYRELLARPEIDAVFVCSPDYLHEAHALAAIRAGKHLYLEKPMAITVAGCDRILRAARKARVKLYLGHNMRHMAFVRKMKELIDAGAIGEIRSAWCRHFVAYGGDAYFKDWHAERSKTTGLLLQKAAHDLDVMHWLCGGYARRVNAFGNLTVYNHIADRRSRRDPPDVSWHMNHWPPQALTRVNPVIDVEDLSMMQMTLDNGVLCAYQQCHYTPDAWRNYTFIGTAGRIENFGDAPGRCVIRLWNRRTDYNPYGDEQFFIPPVTGSHGGADPLIVDEFIRHVRDNDTPTTSPVAARYSVAAGCAATHSLRHGGIPVVVPALPAALVAPFG